jgi:hypothetical protein
MIPTPGTLQYVGNYPSRLAWAAMLSYICKHTELLVVAQFHQEYPEKLSGF